MFLLRLLKKLIILALIVVAVLYFTNYKYKGKSIKEHIKYAYDSGLISEGVKDIKTWLSEVTTLGKHVGDTISDKDRIELERVIKSELKENVSKLKEEAFKKGPSTEKTK